MKMEQKIALVGYKDCGTIKEVLTISFNDLIKSRLKQIPMTQDQLNYYVAGVQDVYMNLTKSKKPFKIDKEIKEAM